MIGVSAVLTFTSAFTKIAGTAVGKAALEWDYLLCSYYHHNRPDPFLVAYIKSVFLFIPRLMGLGPAGERTLYNRLASQAALISFIFIPIESISSIVTGQGLSIIEMAVETFMGVIMAAYYYLCIPCHLWLFFGINFLMKSRAKAFRSKCDRCYWVLHGLMQV